MHETGQIVIEAKRVAAWTCLAALLVGFEARHVFASEPGAGDELASILDRHCVGCHSDGGEAGVNFDAVVTNSAWPADVELLDRVSRVLRFREMPPPSEEDLTADERAVLKSGLRQRLDQVLAEPGHVPRIPPRRMTRFQYANAVQDLFGLKRVVFSLPERMMREYGDYFRPASRKMPDVVTVGSRPLGKSQMIEPRLANVAAFPQDLRAEHGFDNQADHLSLSPLLMEAFLALSRSIVDSPDFSRKNVGIWGEFFADPGPVEDRDAVVRERIERLLSRAFRGNADDHTVDRYAVLANSLISSGQSFPDAMKTVASAAIASPRFLYLYDETEGDDVSEVSDLELASRLSFFLWGSVPDQGLLDSAKSGLLSDEDVLSATVDRMLNDRKLKRFCDSFPTQWLQLDRIVSSAPNRQRFPDFYFSKYNSSMHMMLEPLLVFETVLIEDRPITELIDSPFSYRSARLRKLYYGEDVNTKRNEVTQIRFQRVPVTDRREGGVITTPAAMTMTSGTERTKPITRGAWLANVVFANPPQPPPADVPPLPEKETMDETLTLREQLAAHRERADCAGCHEKIDPLGFALENFGPTGKWRQGYANGRTVDVAGTLFRNHSFESVAEFKDAILAERDVFAAAFVSHVLSFAVAREIEPWDRPHIEAIVDRCREDDFRMRSVLREVVLSRPFRTKSGTAAQHVAAAGVKARLGEKE